MGRAQNLSEDDFYSDGGSVRINRKGSMLVVALWSFSLLATLSMSLAFGARQRATLANREESILELYSTALSGVEKAKGILRAELWQDDVDTLNEPWSNSPTYFKDIPQGRASFTVSYGLPNYTNRSVSIRYGMMDETGKININLCAANTLKLLLMADTELDQDEAEALAYAIIDWRDSDSMQGHPSYSAEDSDYGDLPDPYEAKDSDFQSLSELMLVLGMKRELFDRIEKDITIHGTGIINVNTASELVLKVTLQQDGAVDKMLRFRRGEDGEDGTPDDNYFTSPSVIVATLNAQNTPLAGPEQVAIENAISTGAIGTTSYFFSVHSQAVMAKDGTSIAVNAVLDRKGKVYSLRILPTQWPVKS